MEQVPGIGGLIGNVRRASMFLFEDDDAHISTNRTAYGLWYAPVIQRKKKAAENYIKLTVKLVNCGTDRKDYVAQSGEQVTFLANLL